MISARDLSLRYAAFLHAQLVGDDTEAVDFGLWLGKHWTDIPLLSDEPLLDSLDGDAKQTNAVTWIEHDGEIVGHLAGRSRGCYRIPIDSIPPIVSLFADDALECSTGSVVQERAFAAGRDDALIRPVSSPVSSVVERRSQTQGLPVKQPPPLAVEATRHAPIVGFSGVAMDANA